MDKTPVTPVLAEKIVKRSVRIAGHATSISLERPFWTLLQQIAEHENRGMSSLIEDVDAKRGTNLSSALRLYALDHLMRHGSTIEKS